MMRYHLIPLLLSLTACFQPENESATGIDEYDDDDFPAGNCRDTGTDTDPCETGGTTTGGTDGDLSTTSLGTGEPADRCQSSADCMGGVCAAPFDPETLEREPLDCRFACVPTYDDQGWCADDSACCEERATCTRRGYCVPGG